MTAESIGLITTYLDKIATKIGTTAEHIWPWLVRQQYVEAYYTLAISIILGIMALSVILFVNKHWHPQKDYSDDNTKNIYSIYKEDHEGFWTGLLILLGVLFTVFSLFCISEFGDIFNPEYHALQALLSMAK